MRAGHNFSKYTHSFCVNTFSIRLRQNLTECKRRLPSEDIFTYLFQTADHIDCALIYADGIVDKQLLGDLIARPLSRLSIGDNKEKHGGRYATNDPFERIRKTILFPEQKRIQCWDEGEKEILDGNCLLLIDRQKEGLILGAKLLPTRSVSEPPTDVAVKGPREGFIEDVKTNMALVRKRIKTPDLRFELLRVGQQSQTAVVLCWLEGTANAEIKTVLKKKIEQMQIDCVPDSSYIAAMLAPRKHSLFRCCGTTEKPDIFTAKISEGRIGILVDGSPIALTLPYILSEDLQSSEDYFISPFMATIFRFLRLFSLLVAILLPAFYVSAQLFKLQLLPLSLTLTIASSVRELPLSPSLEMFVVLLLLEILKEASIRMPKYVGMSLSVVGALVLGETAVSAGFLSTPAIIVVAFSGICLYTVPNFVETGSVLRWLFLLISGSLGPFGIVLFSAFLLYYLISSDSFETPLLAPFSPFYRRDLRDAVCKYDMRSLDRRPRLLHSPNRIRFRSDPQTQKSE